MTDLDAKYYTKNSTRQYTYATKLLSNYTFRKDARVLDVGCGDGKITAEIAGQVPEGKVIGVDASPDMIKHATNTHTEEHPHLSFQLDKAENLNFHSEFHTIVSLSCFHWIREAEQALTKLCQFLKPGGEILILTYPKESMYYEFMQEALTHYPEYADLSAYHTNLSTDQYRAILCDNGVEIQELTATDILASYANEDELKDFIRGWLTSFVPIPSEHHEDLLETIVEKCEPYSKDLNNNKLNLPYTELIIKVKKLP